MFQNKKPIYIYIYIFAAI